MTAQVQHIIVIIILAIVAIIVVTRLIHNYKHRNDSTCCNCNDCPLANCSSRRENSTQQER